MQVNGATVETGSCSPGHTRAADGRRPVTCARSTSVAGPRGWRALAKGPAWQVVWAADGGGGLRYLAAGQVIDLSGVNTLPLHGRDAQAFLDAHRPHFIEFVPRLFHHRPGAGRTSAGLALPRHDA
jgi:hypothetical protein